LLQDVQAETQLIAASSLLDAQISHEAKPVKGFSGDKLKGTPKIKKGLVV
jgi:hypothetical protein